VIQAPDGRRMSKSLGTGIDPLDEIEANGADATRFGLLAMSSTQDVRFSAERVRQGRDLANKLWNASRLILLGVQEGVEPSAERAETVEDRWILSRLDRLTERTTALLEGYELSRAALELYAGFWGEVCDWYLELAKPRLWDEEGDRSAVSATLLHVLERSLTLMHPILPFVTEEIWSFMPGDRGLLAVAPWPEPSPEPRDDAAEAVVGRTIEAVTALRRYRDEVGAPAGAVIPARLTAEGYDQTVEQVARLARFSFEPAAEDANGDAIASVAIPGGAVQVLRSDSVDPEEAERRRAQRRATIEKEVARAESKLANEGFTSKAPPQVVEAEREKLERFREELAELEERA
jgi:valyl-tRNA synthetase